MVDSVILQGCFQLLPAEEFYEVRLTREKLLYQATSSGSCGCHRTKPSFVITLLDVYGAKLFRSRTSDNEAAYLHVFTCPLRGNKRVRERICFKVSGWEEAGSNRRLAEKWVRMILWLVKKPSMDLSAIQDNRNLPSSRKLFVLVNPFSGKGKSLKIFNKKVALMFDEAAIEYRLVVTEYAGHAKNIALYLNLEEWDGVVICSGDGLVYELVNGLMSRPDWEAAIKMPIGVIPTGSGNALCYSSLFATGEPMDLTAAIFAVISGSLHDLDIATVVTPNEKIHSFLSVTWGIISDADIESEKYRYLGNARFTVGAMVRIVGLRTYNGRLSYLPYEEETAPVNTASIDVPSMSLAESDELSFKSPTSSFKTPGGSFKSPVGSFVSVEESPSEEQLRRDMVTSHDNEGMHSELPFINNLQGVGIMKDNRSPGPNLSLLSNLKDQLPSTWKTVQGDFILGCSVLLSHLGPDLFTAPRAKFGDGVMYISYIKAGVSRMRLVTILGKMGDGSHLDCEEYVSVKARAFRLEPDVSQAGTIAVDGERVPYTTIQGQIHKGLGRVMCVRPSV